MQTNIFKSFFNDFDTSTFTGAYQATSLTGFPEGCSMLRIINASANVIYVSYDGVNDHDKINGEGTLHLYFQASMGPRSYVGQLPKGTIVYLKSSTFAAGFCGVACYYQPII